MQRLISVTKITTEATEASKAKHLEEMEKKGAEQVEITDASLVDSISTWDENKRIEELLYSKDYRTLSELDRNKLNVQYSVAKLYLEVSNITKDAYQINTILNFNKAIY